MEFHAVEYRSQLVAGMNYLIKVIITVKFITRVFHIIEGEEEKLLIDRVICDIHVCY